MSPKLFRIRGKSQRILLAVAGIEDDGIKLQSPMGMPIKGVSLGDVLIDNEENQFLVKGIGIQSNVVWVDVVSFKIESVA